MDDRKTLIRLDEETSEDEDPIVHHKESGARFKPIETFGDNRSEEMMPTTSSSGGAAQISGNHQHLVEDDLPPLLGNNAPPPPVNVSLN